MSDLWKMFVNGEESGGQVKPLIHQSWQRSKNYNINHQRFENTDILTMRSEERRVGK